MAYHHACHSDVAPNREIPYPFIQDPPCHWWYDEGWWRLEGRYCEGCTRGPKRDEEFMEESESVHNIINRVLDDYENPPLGSVSLGFYDGEFVAEEIEVDACTHQIVSMNNAMGMKLEEAGYELETVVFVQKPNK